MKRLAVILALLILVAPVVDAHGGRDTQSKCSESYCVGWITYVYVVHDEFVRFGYNVTDKGSGDAVDIAGTDVDFIFQDDAGSTVETQTKTLEDHEASGADIADVKIPASGTSMVNDVPLPQGEQVTFNLEVRGTGTNVNGDDGNGENTTPLAGWIVLPALAGAALLLARRD